MKSCRYNYKRSTSGAARHTAVHPLAQRMNDFIAVTSGYRSAERRNRKAAVASSVELAEILLRVAHWTGGSARAVTACYSLLQRSLLQSLQPVTACYSLLPPDIG